MHRLSFKLGLDLEPAGERVRVEPQHPVNGLVGVGVMGVGGGVRGVPPVGVGGLGRVEGTRGLAGRPRGENGGGKFKRHSSHKLSNLSSLAVTVGRCSERELLNEEELPSLLPRGVGPRQTDRPTVRATTRKETQGQGCVCLLACLLSSPLFAASRA